MDPYFASNGVAPVMMGFPGKSSQGQHHRHHRHHKSKHGHAGVTSMNLDGSVNKVVHGQNQFAYQNDNVQMGGGYGLPYGTVTGPYQLQQQYPGAGQGFSSNQYQDNPYGTVGRRHRKHHHHRHHHQVDELVAGAAAPEQVVGHRSTSAFAGRVDGQELAGEARPEKLHRHHHHHHDYRQDSIEQKVSKPSRRSRRTDSKHEHASAGGDGYGHLQDGLIFIERGEHSPHRQQAPSGYKYKGKIEVQCEEETTRSTSRGRVIPPQPQPQPLPLPVPTPHVGPCPPGWQQMMVPPTGVGYPTGATGYSGQGVGGVTGGFGLGGAGAIGTGATGGFGNFGSNYQGQLIADYIVQPGGSGGQGEYQSSYGGHTETHTTTRSKVIEVWQKPSQSESGGTKKVSSDSSDSSDDVKVTTSTTDLDKLRKEILSAIERITKETTKIHTSSNDVGTHTHIHTSTDGCSHDVRPAQGGGEVRVIVQPIQPVFYMPRQTEAPAPREGHGGGSVIALPMPGLAPARSGSPKIVYVPRNVYVPVIKPVFVPRERVIVRPQVIHVARPVLVDRPVPVTQRPIIIDRERPIPVPVRPASQAAAQTGQSTVVQEEYVYRDNLPVAYGGRCSEYAGGVNYGYMPTQQEHQYAASSGHEESVGYQTQVVDQSNYQQSYVETAETNNFSAASAGGGSLDCTGTIEVLDTTVNSSWQRTNPSSLVNQYGATAGDIVQKTGQVEQQMFQELRQRTSSGGSGGVYRSGSSATFSSGGSYQLGPRGHSFSSIPLGEINPLNPEGIPHRGPAPIPVRINY